MTPAQGSKPVPGGRTKTGGCTSTFEVERVDGSLVTVKCQSKDAAISCTFNHLSTVVVKLGQGKYFSQRWAWTDGVKGTKDDGHLRKVQR